MATFYVDLMAGGDVFAIARQIIKQGWDSHDIAKRLGGREDLAQEVSMLLVHVKSGNVAFDQNRKSKRSKKLYASKTDYAREMGYGDQLEAAYAFAVLIDGEGGTDLDATAESIYKTISKGKEKKELDRVFLGKTSNETGGFVSFEGFVMGTVRRRSLGNWMIESPRQERDAQVVVDVRIAADLGGEPGRQNPDKYKGENEHAQEEEEEEEKDALSQWAADEFLRDPDPDLNPRADTETRLTPAQGVLQCKSVDLAPLFGCTPRTVQNMRNEAKPDAH